MPYDTMTETEWEEYEMLYSNPPNTITEQAERFLYLAEKGWAGTRAADDCFEMGNGDLVLSLILEQVRAAPDLKEMLKAQGAWSSDWDEHLKQWDETTRPVIAQFDWNGITIELTYCPQWNKATEDIAHLTIQSIRPLKVPLPVTETGFKSHFFRSDTPMTEDEIKALVCDWLDEAAQEATWQKSQQERMQLTLF